MACVRTGVSAIPLNSQPNAILFAKKRDRFLRYEINCLRLLKVTGNINCVVTGNSEFK